MTEVTAAHLSALVAAGMGISFLVADPRTPTSRALSIALLAAAASIHLDVTYVAAQGPAAASWIARTPAIAELVAFVALYQWIIYLRQTIPAAEHLQTRFGDRMMRVAQALVVVYAVESILWPELRAAYFQNALGAPGAARAYQFYLFALPLEISMLLAAGSVVLLLNRRPDPAERRRLIWVTIATPVMASAMVLPREIAPLAMVGGEMILLVGAIQFHVSQGQRSQFIGRFLSPQVERLVRRQGMARAMRQETREIAVVCCDLRGFTRLSGQLQSDKTLQMLSTFYDAIGEVTTELGATIKDYAGDGVLVLIGAPIACEDARARAVRLACRLREAVAPVLEQWSRPDAPLGLGIGVASGPVTVGVIGGARLEYVAVGQAVNLAARLCDRANAGEILVDEVTARSADEPVEPRAAIELKGFAQPVSYYALGAA